MTVRHAVPDGRPGPESELEWVAANRIERAGLPAPVYQYRFHPERRWRLDLAYPERRIGIELQGATWAGGRHVRGAGYEGDCHKLNTAQLMGWRVLVMTRGMVEDGSLVAQLRRALEGG